MFRLTPAAAEQVRHAAQEGGTEEMALRFAAYKRADGTIDYKMGFDAPTEEDIRLQCEGVEVIMEPEYVPLMDTAILDFVALEPGNFQFIFLNPQDAEFRPPEED